MKRSFFLKEFVYQMCDNRLKCKVTLDFWGRQTFSYGVVCKELRKRTAEGDFEARVLGGGGWAAKEVEWSEDSLTLCFLGRVVNNRVRFGVESERNTLRECLALVFWVGAVNH